MKFIYLLFLNVYILLKVYLRYGYKDNSEIIEIFKFLCLANMYVFI